MADPQAILRDPDFLGAQPETQRAILATHDPDFAGASPQTQDEILTSFRRSTGEIKVPETFGQGVIRGAKSMLPEILPTAGAIGGGLLGAATGGLATGPLAPLGAGAGAVVGTGLGYTAGQQGNRLIESIFNAATGKPQPSTSVLSQAGQVAKDFGTGATMELGGQGLARGAGALADVLRSSGVPGFAVAAPADMAVRAAAQRQGIDLPAGAASGSGGTAFVESIPMRFPLGRSTAEPTFTRVHQQAQQAAERVGQGMGPARSMESAGQAVQRDVGDIARAQESAPSEIVGQFIDSLGASRQGKLSLGGSVQEGLGTAQTAARGRADALYAAARATLPEGAEVPLTTTARVAANMSALERQLGALGTKARGPAQTLEGLSTATPSPESQALIDTLRGSKNAPMYQEMIDQFGLDQARAIPVDLALELQKRLRSAIRNTTDDYTKRKLGDLAQALTTDLGGLGGAFQTASNAYRAEVAPFFTPRAPLRRLMDTQPGGIADRVMNTTSPDLLRDLMAQLPARQQSEVQRMVFERIKDRSINPRTGEIDPGRFEAQLQRFGDENLGLLLGPRARELTGLRDTLRSGFGRDTSNPALAGALTAQPESLVPSLIRGRVKSLDDFDAIWQTASPASQQQIRSATFNDILSRSFDDKTGFFSVERFLTQKAQVPQEIWDRMLAADSSAALADLQMVFQRMTQFSRMAANPSQTAQGILGPSQVLGGMALAGSTALGREDPESFALKAGALLSPAVLGKAVFSGPGQRLLTSRPPGGQQPGGMGGIGLLNRMLGIQLAPSQREPIR